MNPSLCFDASFLSTDYLFKLKKIENNTMLCQFYQNDLIKLGQIESFANAHRISYFVQIFEIQRDRHKPDPLGQYCKTCFWKNGFQMLNAVVEIEIIPR
jgi:hypothetical protein